MRHLVFLLMGLSACTAAREAVITREGSAAVVQVDADTLPTDEASRERRLEALATTACGAEPARIAARTQTAREEVQLDLDRVVARTRGPAPSAWAPGPHLGSALSGRSTIPTSTPLPNAKDDRATRVRIPVWELAVTCGG
ncbi:MAG: hypothetical protein JNJ54_01450 [Myxococcaceae bacterium]|nr:hypothetical protein [Myxococcaceae bacterium]